MLKSRPLGLAQTVNILKAVGETTRLRLLALLNQGDLTVSDLIEILGQSQPRISRHLKLMSDAGLLERYQEGAWAYFRVSDEGRSGELVRRILEMIDMDDEQVRRDLDRLASVRERRAERAAKYFADNADKWDELRALHVDESEVEQAMLDLLGKKPFSAMLDLGTGTGRLLELFSDLYEKGVGIDASRDMLTVARNNLDRADLSRVQVRQGDLYVPPVSPNSFDLITIHQVLHYLDDPQRALREAAKALAPGGRLLIVDFAPHDLEFLREQHAHLRLGISDAQMREWLTHCGLEVLESRELAGTDNEASTHLKVTLWLARDPRMLIANQAADGVPHTLTRTIV